MVVVLVGEDDLLDVLDPQPVRGKRRLELDARLGPVGARVDQRQRLASQQVAVDGPDGEGNGERRSW